MKRKVPRMTTDEEAEAFLEQDLPTSIFRSSSRCGSSFSRSGAAEHAPAGAVARGGEGRGQGPGRPLHPVYPRGSGAGDGGKATQPPALNFALPFCRFPTLCRSTA